MRGCQGVFCDYGFAYTEIPYVYFQETAYALPRPPVYIHKEIEVQPSFIPTVSVHTVRPKPTVARVTTTTTSAPLFEEQVLATQRTTQPQFFFTTPSTTPVRHEVSTYGLMNASIKE
ncbi:hypothetical protein ANCCAN_13138 [Ancylostoma caninum]|uniref:Uncharacterized protein n=1 Tax=Ancylostoma caninum TaxID=29170 RepID=A0A368G925_ANCCA|nr:hypothetical protein ANCCAN_13138 [Ancylostoma caninum]